MKNNTISVHTAKDCEFVKPDTAPGAWEWARNIARAFARAGITVVIYTPEDESCVDQPIGIRVRPGTFRVTPESEAANE